MADLQRYIVTVRGTREVTTEVVVAARNEDAAWEEAYRLVESDQFGELDWQLDGDVTVDDVDYTEECDDSEPLTVVRTRW